MTKAGNAAFQLIKERWPKTQSIIIFCGGGNNGGDGYVVARLAFENKLKVQVRYIGDLQKLKGEAFNAMQKCQQASVEILPFDANEKLNADVFVDALLGIGLQGNVRESTVTVIDTINNSTAKILSVDIPSGLQADSGAVFGAAVHANHTITFIGLKQGLFAGDAPDYCGEIFCNDLDLSKEWFSQVKPSAKKITSKDYSTLLKPRARTTHKGQLGHVLVVGGDYGMGGAPCLAALGAARIGAGLVTVATRREHTNIINIIQPELMSRGIEKKKDLSALLAKATVVVIGPGLGQSKWSEKLLSTVLDSELPLIIDADGLNLLAKKSLTRPHWILTPHPGEAARLLKKHTKDIQANRYQAAHDIQKQYGGICILKGAGSIIYHEFDVPTVCTAGNPGMASGGMGDLLAGIIGGLVAQGIALADAACLGVCLHAEAGDKVAEKQGEHGMLATDLLLSLGLRKFETKIKGD